MTADDIYQCLNISISLYSSVTTLKNLSNMKVTTQRLYHQPSGEAILGEFVEYFYDFMENLPGVKSVREKYEATTHARKHECGLLKS